MTEEDVCEMTEENNDFSDKNLEDSVGECDFSDENLSVSDENIDVTEKEFRVKEKEIEVFVPFFSEETATRRVADEVSIFESEDAQKRIPQDVQNDTQDDAEFDAENTQFDAQNDAEFEAKNSAKSDAKSVLQMCTNVLQEDRLQSDANEHFNTVPHARVNKQTNKRTNKA